MIAAVDKAGIRMAINWPLAWYPTHVTAKRLVDEGAIGRISEVHYYDGNRGPLYHVADKIEVGPREGRRAEAELVVVQEGRRRRQSPRLSRLRRHPRHLVPRRRGADRGDDGRRPARRARGRRALDHDLPLRARACRSSRRAGGRSPIRGRCSRSRNAVSSSSAAEGTISSYDYETHDPAADARSTPSSTRSRSTRLRRRAARPIEYMLHCKETGEADRRPARSEARADRPADRRHRGALGGGEAHRGSRPMTGDAPAGKTIDPDSYALVTAKAAEVAAPELPYRPRDPKSYRPGIGADRRRRHHLRPSRRVQEGRLSTSLAICQPDPGESRRAARRLLPRRRDHRRIIAPSWRIPTSRSSTSPPIPRRASP